jgi:hypothetical protein
VEHKRAVKNISVVRMDSTDFGQLKRAIESLGWKERSYLMVKKELLRKLALMPSRESAAYLKEIYYRAGDTAVLQYAAFETLLSQQTTDAYQAFAGIMQNDPPVLDMEDGEKSFVTTYRNNPWPKTTGNKTIKFNGSFFDNLTDSLQLTAGIIESMLPLLTVNDYQRPVMELLGTLVDSSLIQPSSYKSYLPKFILEARQMLKKQQIREKAKAIEKAEEEEKKTYNPYDPDNNTYGNIQLSLYATLILPFWNQNPQVQPIMQQLLISADNRLRYNTAMLLLRNGRPVADTILASFAALDEFRQELYTDLKNMKREDLFPAVWKSQESMARSRLAALQSYNKPDTIAYLKKMPVQYNGGDGVVYFFKYKEKKEDKAWKIAAAGIYPKDSTVLSYFIGDDEEGDEDDFTTLSNTKLTTETTEDFQLEKFRKRLIYSRRKSAARFYEEGSRYENFDFTRMQ